MSQEFTFKEVAQHSSKEDLFLVIYDGVYNTTNFVESHPGGEEVMAHYAGKDATTAFEDVGHSEEARDLLESFLVGKLRRVQGDPEVLSKRAPVFRAPLTPGWSVTGGRSNNSPNKLIGRVALLFGAIGVYLAYRMI